MGRPKHTAEEIISELREAEVLQAKGTSIEEAMRPLASAMQHIANGVRSMED